jgi:uncharacterized protein YciI
MQFVITALDYTDEEALGRRLANREAHLAGAKKLVAEGKIISGGAIIGDNGRMLGSTLHVDFPDRESLDAHLATDPYVTGKVWEKIEIRPAAFLPVRELLAGK